MYLCVNLYLNIYRHWRDFKNIISVMKNMKKQLVIYFYFHILYEENKPKTQLHQFTYFMLSKRLISEAVTSFHNQFLASCFHLCSLAN